MKFANTSENGKKYLGQKGSGKQKTESHYTIMLASSLPGARFAIGFERLDQKVLCFDRLDPGSVCFERLDSSCLCFDQVQPKKFD